MELRMLPDDVFDFTTEESSTPSVVPVGSVQYYQDWWERLMGFPLADPRWTLTDWGLGNTYTPQRGHATKVSMEINARVYDEFQIPYLCPIASVDEPKVRLAHEDAVLGRYKTVGDMGANARLISKAPQLYLLVKLLARLGHSLAPARDSLGKLYWSEDLTEESAEIWEEFLRMKDQAEDLLGWITYQEPLKNW